MSYSGWFFRDYLLSGKKGFFFGHLERNHDFKKIDLPPQEKRSYTWEKNFLLLKVLKKGSPIQWKSHKGKVVIREEGERVIYA